MFAEHEESVFKDFRHLNEPSASASGERRMPSGEAFDPFAFFKFLAPVYLGLLSETKR
jgi:hypothetical protein